jgi:molybdate transport system substrate-binding protein
MRTYLISIPIILVLIIIAGCSSGENSKSSPVKNTELTISAAASLKDVMEKIQKEYELDHPDVKIKFNFGGSGSLKTQIAQGAPVDMFFSASEDRFYELIEEGLVTKDDTVTLVENNLVLVVPNDNPYHISSLQDLIHSNIDRISIGIPETVPAGQYAKESLINQGLWDKLETKIVYAKDVRQVLSFVGTENVEAGIVYKTDALISDKITIASVIDSSTHKTIHYPIGIVKDTKSYDAAKDFYNYLQNDKVIGVFKEYGFNTK